MSLAARRGIQGESALKARILLAGLAALSLVGAEALACPVCNSDTGVAVRAGIFDARFWSNAAAVAAPFPIIIAVVATLRFGTNPRDWLRRGRAAGGKKDSRFP